MFHVSLMCFHAVVIEKIRCSLFLQCICDDVVNSCVYQKAGSEQVLPDKAPRPAPNQEIKYQTGRLDPKKKTPYEECLTTGGPEPN